MLIEALEPSVRLYNCLKRAGIDTVEQLSVMTDDELMNLRYFGAGLLAEVRSKIPVPRKTNADCIRAMSDHNLARFLDNVHWSAFESNRDINNLEYPSDSVGWKKWLKQPSEEDSHGR